jgi:uncharacterized protein YggU (UPF0235/DUF167 family)
MKTAFQVKAGLTEIPLIGLVHKKWLCSEMRVKIFENKVDQYAQEKKKGSLFPPPVVFLNPSEIYYVGDGFHRILADKKNGLTKIQCNVRPGGLKEAILHNLKANREGQGILFQHGDFTKAVKVMLTSPEFKGWTNRQIANAVGCTFGLVSRVVIKYGFARKKQGRRPVIIPEEVIAMLKQGMTHKEIAEKLGVSERTTYRREIMSYYMTCPTCSGKGKILKGNQ